jgi:hypothetical protein
VLNYEVSSCWVLEMGRRFRRRQAICLVGRTLPTHTPLSFSGHRERGTRFETVSRFQDALLFYFQCPNTILFSSISEVKCIHHLIILLILQCSYSTNKYSWLHAWAPQSHKQMTAEKHKASFSSGTFGVCTAIHMHVRLSDRAPDDTGTVLVFMVTPRRELVR